MFAIRQGEFAACANHNKPENDNPNPNPNPKWKGVKNDYPLLQSKNIYPKIFSCSKKTYSSIATYPVSIDCDSRIPTQKTIYLTHDINVSRKTLDYTLDTYIVFMSVITAPICVMITYSTYFACTSYVSQFVRKSC